MQRTEHAIKKILNTNAMQQATAYKTASQINHHPLISFSAHNGIFG